MTHHRNLLIGSVFALGLSSACSVHEDLEVDHTDQEIGCPASVCGVNSNMGNDLPVGELHLYKDQNHGRRGSGNTEILDFTAPNGDPGWIVRVKAGRIEATKGPNKLEGAQLKGSKFLIENHNDGSQFELTLTDHDRDPSWTAPVFDIDRYLFTVPDPDDPTQQVPICAKADTLTDPEAWSVIVSKERYDWLLMAIGDTGEQAGGWFNIACNGYALYKTKMMGYDPDGDHTNPHDTTPEQRQATLKLMVADYCGTGQPFTVDGTSLEWENTVGWSLTAPSGNAAFEAYWQHDGAACLDTPRLGIDQLQSIQNACAAVGKSLPACTNYNGPYDWLTRVPL